ncbi:MAG: hypothetical protein M3377_06710, partial [Actinomycetota bacterium]|nr:hypothetical protein [Actinomycetota bacterium]
MYVCPSSPTNVSTPQKSLPSGERRILRIHRDLVHREVAEAERERRIVRLGDRERVEWLERLGVQEPDVAPAVEDRADLDPLADRPDGDVLRIRVRLQNRHAEEMVERLVRGADAHDHVHERARSAERRNGLVVGVAHDMPIDEEDGVPAGEHGLVGLFAGEARLLGRRRIPGRATLEDDDRLVSGLQQIEVTGNVLGRRNCRRVGTPVSAVDDRTAQRQVIEDRGRRRSRDDDGRIHARVWSRRDLELVRTVRREVLVRPDDEAVVDRPLGLMGVALGRERDSELLEQLRVDRRVLEVGDVLRIRRVVDVQDHPAAVPVGQEHVPGAVDLLHDHVVQGRVDQTDFRLVDVEVVQVELRNQPRPMR